MRTLKQGIFLASWQRLMVSGGNCSSMGRFFIAADAIVNIPSMKAARLNRKMRSSNLQQNKTKTGNSRISLKLPQRFIRMQKTLPKRPRWNKMMLLWDSQSRRRVVLRQRWDRNKLESDFSSAANKTQQQRNAGVQGWKVGEVNETGASNQKKETLAVIPPTPIENQRLNTGKSLLTQNAQKENRNADDGTKKKKGLRRFKFGHKKR